MSPEFKARIKQLQVNITVLHILLIVIGACIFGLAVAVRPVLRITKPEFDYMVRTFCDVMVATGISQILSGGLDIFAACWRLKWPAYIAIILSVLVIILNMAAMATAFYLLTQAEIIVNENILHAWYWVECREGSCRLSMLHYIHRYMMPQAALAALAVFIQCMGVMYLSRLLRVILEHHRLIRAHRLAQEEFFEGQRQNAKAKKRSTKKDKIAQVEGTTFLPTDHLETSEFSEDNFHTPTSILKGDHGYIAASGASLDFDDSPVRNRNKVQNTPSISFNTNVQVHYFDVKDKLNSVDLITCLKNENPALCSINRAVDNYKQILKDEEIEMEATRINMSLAAQNLAELLGGDSPHITLDGGGRGLSPPPPPPPTPNDLDDCCGPANLTLPVTPIRVGDLSFGWPKK